MPQPLNNLIGSILFFGSCLTGSGQSERSTWFSEKWQIVENVRSGIGGEAEVEKLGVLVAGLGEDEKSLKPEVKNLYEEGVKTLLADPAHAGYFASKIAQLTEEEIKGSSTAHQSQRGWYYETLSELRSPQTVKVLGELVFDERDPWKDGDWGDGGRPYANSFHAVKAFHKLGLKHPPVARDYPHIQGDVRTWQLWYEQVRAGTRTFSFEGDDTIYTLTGPVTESREPSRPPARSVSPPPADQMEKPSAWKLTLAVLGACLTLLALLFVALRKPKRSGAT